MGSSAEYNIRHALDEPCPRFLHLVGATDYSDDHGGEVDNEHNSDLEDPHCNLGHAFASTSYQCSKSSTGPFPTEQNTSESVDQNRHYYEQAQQLPKKRTGFIIHRVLTSFVSFWSEV